MKTNNATLIIKTAPDSWLVPLFTTESWWLHFVFVSGAWIAGIAAIYFYSGDVNPGWHGTIFQVIICVYFGRNIGRILLRGKLIRFLLAFFSTWILISFSGCMTLYDRGISYHHSLLLTTIAVSPAPFIALCLGIFLKLLRYTIRQQQADATQQKSELDLLLSQLSPHFLFNTLNNLYGLSLTQQQRMPALILKLSDLLRYAVYDAKQIFVPLKLELAYINNYIELAATSIGDRLVLTTDIAPVIDPAIRIAPMLLIVFIENAFKHSQNSAASNIYIDIHLTIAAQIIFTVKNSYDEKESKSAYERGGMGIANSMKRLQLLYDKEYEYRYEKENGVYTVTLVLNKK